MLYFIWQNFIINYCKEIIMNHKLKNAEPIEYWRLSLRGGDSDYLSRIAKKEALNEQKEKNKQQSNTTKEERTR